MIQQEQIRRRDFFNLVKMWDFRGGSAELSLLGACCVTSKVCEASSGSIQCFFIIPDKQCQEVLYDLLMRVEGQAVPL
jgi:hypothetical protein